MLFALGLVFLTTVYRSYTDMAGRGFKVDVHTHPVPEVFREALVDAGYMSTDDGGVFVDGFFAHPTSFLSLTSRSEMNMDTTSPYSASLHPA